MIKCIAVDDEPLALDQIVRFIGRIPELELVAACYSAQQALEAMQKQPVDVMFIDIEMPDGNGMDFARHMQGSKPCLVFTTAYPQFAAEGFKVDAVDYLLKPLSFDDMKKAVEKVKRRLAANPTDADPYLYVKVNGVMRKLHFDDLAYIKGLGEYVQICVEGESRLLTTLLSIKHLEGTLPASKFMRVHKSYIINLDKVTEADRTQAKVHGEAIPVGEKYRPAFTHYIKQHIK